MAAVRYLSRRIPNLRLGNNIDKIDKKPIHSSIHPCWEGIPLDNGQWKERVFIVVLASMNLTECHRMAIPGDPMCGLHVVR